MEIGERIRTLRESAGLSQTELAEKIKVLKQTLYKYEKGIITNIPSDKIEALTKVFGVSEAYLMGWDDKFNNPVKDALFHAEILKDSEYIEMYKDWKMLSVTNKKVIIDMIKVLCRQQE